MAEWDSDLYLSFKRQRTQPAIDLANRVGNLQPGTVIDVGCGPGNSTAVLKSVFPGAGLLGIDSSQSMIDKAKQTYPDIEFALNDAHEISGRYDLIFSNACLQWIPGHKELLPELTSKLSAGGTLAVQVPCNASEPLYRIIFEVADEARWGLESKTLDVNEVLSPEEYFNILSSCSSSFDIWETVYYHALPSHRALVDWVKGTRLRPYLNALDEKTAAEFEREILKRTIRAYPVMKNGSVILRFRRLFFTAVR